jgi:lipid-A-disaccharide synthase
VSDREVLVVAGEPSGDRIAALVARALGHGRMFGLAGPVARAAGVDVVADIASDGAFGISDVATSAPALAAALVKLIDLTIRRPPRAALLVNFTELNTRLGRFLKARGTRVLWCVAPQVWAWRASRLATLGRSLDRLAVILPFEEALWRSAGVDAVYVGHPSADVALARPLPPKRSLRALAVLPGSRPGEIARLLSPLAQAARALVDDATVAEAAIIVAPSLPARSRALVEEAARRTHLEILDADTDDGAGPLLFDFDLALVASGTASLEAALAGALPIVTYRLDAIAHLVASRLVKTPHVALANVLLRRRAFPELLQRDVTVEKIAGAGRALLAGDDGARAAVVELRAMLKPPSPATFGERVAALLAPWLRIE